MSPDKPLAGAFPFPLPPYPTGGMIAQTPPFDFRINVTAAVSSWFSNWATRNDIPFHGFTLVGTDETMPEDDTTSLQITYAVTLQFDVDEPDR
jgi:hypothetical protein